MRAAYDTKVRMDMSGNGPMEPNDPERFGFGRRTGILGWWLNLTAPPPPDRLLDIGKRERLRKAELTSLSILAVFLFLLTLVSNSLAHPATAEAVIVMTVGLVFAAIFNRTGRTRIAAYLVPGLLMLLIALAIIGTKTLDPYLAVAYDLFVIPIILTSLTGDRRAPWYFAAIAIVFIVADFYVQPHAMLMGNGATPTGFDGIAYEIRQVGVWGSINRHVALSLFAAFFGWLGARSVDRAITRADQAEEVAELERRQLEQRRMLEQGVKQLLDVHIRLANGDYSARAALREDNELFVVGRSLNNLVDRLQKAGEWEFQYTRMREEIERLALALDDARAGRRPFWPAPTQTPVDMLIARIAPQSRTALPPSHRDQEQNAPAAPPMPPWNPGVAHGQTATQAAANPFAAFPPATGNLSQRQRSPFSNPGGANPNTDNPWFAPE